MPVVAAVVVAHVVVGGDTDVVVCCCSCRCCDCRNVCAYCVEVLFRAVAAEMSWLRRGVVELLFLGFMIICGCRLWLRFQSY